LVKIKLFVAIVAEKTTMATVKILEVL